MNAVEQAREGYLLSEVLRLFLDSIGRSEEYQFYLRKFQSERSPCLALLCPDNSVGREGREALASALLFLLRLDLTAALLFSGPKAEEACSLLCRLPLLHDRYHLFRPDPSQFSQRVLLKESEKACQDRRIFLILWPEILLTTAIQKCTCLTERVYLIRLTGGIKTPSKATALHYYFNRSNDNPSEIENYGHDLPLIRLAHGLYQALPQLHLSVTSPFGLLKEIFTVKGAGTIFRMRSVIHTYTGLEQFSVPHLKKLLKESFGRPLRNDDFLRKSSCFYVEANYQGAILLEKHHAGLYLSKFAVGTDARGIGISEELWQLMVERNRAIFWRSQRGNFINRWYMGKANGSHQAAEWIVFWSGIEVDHIAEVIAFCLHRPADFL